jgi:hypothetical protein
MCAHTVAAMATDTGAITGQLRETSTLTQAKQEPSRDVTPSSARAVAESKNGDSKSGEPVTEICRRLSVSANSFYQWKRKFQGIGVIVLPSSLL